MCWRGYLRSTQCAVLLLRLRFAISSLKSWSGRLARDVTPVPSAAAARRWLFTATTPFVYLCPNSPLLPASHLLPVFNLAVVCLCIWPTFFGVKYGPIKPHQPAHQLTLSLALGGGVSYPNSRLYFGLFQTHSPHDLLVRERQRRPSRW